MRNPKRWGAVLCLGIVLAMVSSASATILVRVELPATMPLPGETFVIHLFADTGTESVVGWGLDLSYDAQVIAGVAPPVIGPFWQPAFAPDGDGLAGAADPFSDPDQNGLYGSVGGNAILLATLTFQALQPGQTVILPGATAADLNEGFALDPIGFAEVVYQPATLTVLPEPALIAPALLLFGILRPRRGR